MIKCPQKSAFTLVEVMIGVAVFGILAAGVASATLLSSRIAVSNIYSNTAHAVAHGYAEQIKSISHHTIRDALNDPQNKSIPTMSLSLGGGTDIEQDDPLTFGVRSQKDIVVDVERTDDGADRERIMRMWITPTGHDLATGTDALDAIEITLNFEWEVLDRSVERIHEGVVKIVKTNVTEY